MTHANHGPTPAARGVLDAVYLFGVSTSRRRKDAAEESVLAATGEPEQLEHSDET